MSPSRFVVSGRNGVVSDSMICSSDSVAVTGRDSHRKREETQKVMRGIHLAERLNGIAVV